MKTLDIPDIFRSDAESLAQCRANALRIHPTDIRAAGNEVETSVRDYFRRILPPKYYVTHGHLIDIKGDVSSQIDIVVADNANLPSLLTVKDGTEYIPIDSVYAIGEIKSTFYKSKKPLEEFSNAIEDIRTRLFHEEILNDAFDSLRTGNIEGDASMQHLVLGKTNRYLNRLFAFSLFVDAGDFEFADVAQWLVDREQRFLPNVAVLLNKTAILWASCRDDGIKYCRDPQDSPNGDEEWISSPQVGRGSGSIDGNHLGLLFYMLTEHLNNSYLEPPALAKYLHGMLTGRKSMTQKASDFVEKT